MVSSSAIFALASSALALARPTYPLFKRNVNAILDNNILTKAVAAQLHCSRADDARHCGLANVSIPVRSTNLNGTSTSLPHPTGKLAHVAVGRGTQNYTCADSTDNSKPVSAGAIANLYDASCIASASLSTLNALPSFLLQSAPYPSAPQSDMLGDVLDQFLNENLLLGHHYFTSQGGKIGPTFNLDTSNTDVGYVNAKSGKNVTAPITAPKGLKGEGAVAWLQLGGAGGAQGDQTTFSEVYRIETAGGDPPKTCKGISSSFEVQYAAQYWFYH